MIEEALRKRIEPIVKRRRRLHLALRLSIYWLIAALVGFVLMGANKLWGWGPPLAVALLCGATVLATVVTIYKTRHMQPDYRAAARNIEQQHPEARALLLAAIEQQPEGPDGQLGYLQESVIGEALRHGAKHDWLQSVAPRKLMLAKCAQVASLLLLLLILSRVTPRAVFEFAGRGPAPAKRGYDVTVTPGDTDAELGTPVVILARFDGIVPPEVSLLFGEAGAEAQRIVLSKNLEDPVFGGIITEVNSDLLYHIEYANKRTRDYRISIYEHPTLTRADAKIVYPEFTRLPEKIIRDTRQVSAVEGSQIGLTFILNKAVTTAQLLDKEGSALDLTVDSEHPNVYTTSITATEDRRFELNLTDARGLANKVPQRLVIDVHKNLPPELKPLFPNRDVVASPLEELDLEAEVSDDYGVTGYGLTYALAGSQSKDLTLAQSIALYQKQSIQYLLQLEKLSARPDQLLTYAFWADDVGSDGKARRTFSDMYFAEVRHFEEIFRESEASQSQQRQNQQQQGQQQQGQQQDQLAQLQKQIISATWNIKRQAAQSASLDRQQKEDVDVVLQSQADVLQKAQSALAEARDPSASQALQDASKHMERSVEHLGEAIESAAATKLTPALSAEQAAYQELLKLKRQDNQVGRSRQSSGRSNSGRSARSQQQLQQLELRQKEDRYEIERSAQSQQQTAQREDLQVLNRLRELARRQNEMSNKLKELQAALRQAETEEQRQEIRRQLKRLREEQLEALRDVDELQRRMEEPQNRQRMSEAREQLADSRSRIRQSAEELEQEMVSRAVTSTTRAGRQLEQMRDEFRRRTSGQFEQEMRQMRDQAQQLDERQKEITDEIQRQLDLKQKTLVDSGAGKDLAERIEEQKQSAEELVERMKEVSEQSEISEPLLSKKLYDTVRQKSTGDIDRSLEVAGELLRRNFLRQAQEVEKPAAQGIEGIRKGVEEAAQSVLGDEAEAIRTAQRQLDELIRQVDEEAERAGRAGQRQSGDSNEPGAPATDQRRRADARRRAGGGRGGDPNEPASSDQQQRTNAQRGGRQGSQDPNQPQQATASANAGGGGNRQTDSQRQGNGQRSSQRDGQRQANNRNADGRADPSGWGGGQRLPDQWGGTRGPITGEDFRQWSDRLRDVEEMLSQRDLRNEAARVRDRARSIRVEFKRHGKEPQWDLVREQISRPLVELSRRLDEELAKLESREALVPIDRDPVPGRFAELVRRYYENLGGGDQ